MLVFIGGEKGRIRELGPGGRPVCDVRRSGLCAKSAQEIDDKTDQQNKAKSSTADCGTAKVKAAAAEQEEKNEDQEKKVHGRKVTRHFRHCHGVL